MIRRRSFLRVGLGAAATILCPARRVLSAVATDDPTESKALGQLFVYGEFNVGAEKLKGVFSIDVQTSTWKLITSEGTPSSRVSPDGRTIAYVSSARSDLDEAVRGVWLCPTDGGEARRLTEIVGRPFWSRDGQQLVLSGAPDPADQTHFETWRINADGSGKTRLPIPDDDIVLDWSRDGEWFLVSSARTKPDESPIEFTLRSVFAVRPDGSDRRCVTEGGQPVRWRHTFAPGNRSAIYFQIDGEDCSLWIVDLDGKNRHKLVGEHDDEAPFGAIGSPDGTKLAILRFDCSRGEDGKKRDIIRGCRIEITDTNGAHGRFLHLPPAGTVWLLDWR